jgi:hypothetical protein
MRLKISRLDSVNWNGEDVGTPVNVKWMYIVGEVTAAPLIVDVDIVPVEAKNLLRVDIDIVPVEAKKGAEGANEAIAPTRIVAVRVPAEEAVMNPKMMMMIATEVTAEATALP